MVTSAAEVRHLDLPFIQVHELQDADSGERRQLLLSQAGSADGQAGCRLLVLLDGNLSAVPAALMLHTRMERGVGHLPTCTVVGVGYPGVRFYDGKRRALDYLPTLPPGQDSAVNPSGQAEAFSRFLDTQLLPWLEAQQGAPYAEIGLFGHSYGGLFALYKLLHQPGRINTYFSISPSLWWADGWLLDQLAVARERCAGRTVFLGIGDDERAMPGDDEQRMALHAERDLQGRFARLVTELQRRAGADVRIQAETFAGEDHGSVLYPALARAVRWLLRDHAIPSATDRIHP